MNLLLEQVCRGLYLAQRVSLLLSTRGDWLLPPFLRSQRVRVLERALERGLARIE